jgi:hypothetical protein
MAEAEPEDPAHPLDAGIQRLDALTDEDIRGTSRLGSLSFDGVPAQVREAARILRDLRLEDWDRFDDGFKSTLINQTGNRISTLDQMQALNAGDPNAAIDKQRFEQSLNEVTEWFLGSAQPRAFRARLQDELRRSNVDTGYEEAARLRAELTTLSEQLTRTRAELESIRPVVEAGRAAAGASGAADLAGEYRRQANDHHRDWQRWQWISIASIVVAIGGSLLVVLVRHPTGDATTARAVSRFLIDLLVIGLLLYIVRITALQFRVHRHLEATDRSKAAALETFARIVATGTEPSTRDVLAATLAQAVFTPGDSGFIGGSDDHITLIERVVAPVAQRVAPGS